MILLPILVGGGISGDGGLDRKFILLEGNVESRAWLKSNENKLGKLTEHEPSSLARFSALSELVYAMNFIYWCRRKIPMGTGEHVLIVCCDTGITIEPKAWSLQRSKSLVLRVKLIIYVTLLESFVFDLVGR